MRYKKSELIHALIWLLFAFYILLAHWIWFGRGIQEDILLVLLFLGIIKLGKPIMKDLFFLIILSVLLMEMLFSTVTGTSHYYFQNDIKDMGGGLLCLIYFTLFCFSKKKHIIRVLKKTSKLLFIYAWINSFLILIQFLMPGFFMNKRAITSVGSDVGNFDQLTGLLGVNGTTRWNLFSCFIVLLYLFDIQYNYNSKNSIKKQYIKLIAFVTVCIVIALLSSSRSFFITLPMFILLLFLGIRKVTFGNRMKYVIIAVVIVLVLFIALFLFPGLKDSFFSIINDKFAMYSTFNFQYLVAANDDRGVAVDYAIKSGGLWGNGIGFVPMHSSNSITQFLGLNSISSYIMLIGIIGFFLTTAFWAYNITKMIFGCVTLLRFIVSFICLLILSYLLPIYSSFALPFLICLICIVFSCEADGIYVKTR